MKYEGGEDASWLVGMKAGWCDEKRVSALGDIYSDLGGVCESQTDPVAHETSLATTRRWSRPSNPQDDESPHSKRKRYAI